MAIEKSKYDIEQFINKEIPAEILEQLKIAGRIEHVLSPTQTSSTSTSAQDPDIPFAVDLEKELDEIIANTNDLELLVEQLEDLEDEHLKDMIIAPTNDTIANAAKQMGSEDGTITQQVLENALATIDYWPMMSLGRDPIGDALTGNGKISGDWVECNQITQALADQLTNPKLTDPQAEDAIQESSSEIADDHEKRMIEMILEILLQLWWNMLWPKFVVDMTIINPLKMAIANPVDTVILFFTSFGKGKRNGISYSKKRRFKKPNSTQLAAKGPLNGALYHLRLLLLCKIPPKMYVRYDPIVEIDCKGIEDKCPPPKEPREIELDGSDGVAQLGGEEGMLAEAIDGLCFTSNDLIGDASTTMPTGFGASPVCAKAAVTVVNAVISDALTPPDGEYKPGGAGSTKDIIFNTVE